MVRHPDEAKRRDPNRTFIPSRAFPGLALLLRGFCTPIWICRLFRTVETTTGPARRAGATPGPLDDGWKFGQHRRPKHNGRMPRKIPSVLILQFLKIGRPRTQSAS